MQDAIRQEFLTLCAKVQAVYQSSDGRLVAEPVDTEPILIDLLHLVENHPEHRNTFIDLFMAVADWKITTPWFLLGFCMHRLRYTEIRDHLQVEYNDGRKRGTFGRRLNYLHLNLEVFSDRDELFVQMWPFLTNNHPSPAEQGSDDANM